jgi:hypothetical protein
MVGARLAAIAGVGLGTAAAVGVGAGVLGGG